MTSGQSPNNPSGAPPPSLSARFGTVWWVDEMLWKERIKTYDPHSTKSGHPGVSIREDRPSITGELIPMLHGTSGSQGPVVVRGLFASYPVDYPTSVGKPIAPIPGMEFDGSARRVRVNRNKPHLEPEEEEALKNWAQKKGLC